MTELSFLVDLLLNHKLPKTTKDLVAARIKEVEESLSRVPMAIRMPLPPPPQGVLPPHIASQTPSMQKIMMRNLDLAAPTVGMAPIPAACDQASEQPINATAVPPPQPVTVVAQTIATAAAMNSRNQAIAESLAGKIDKITGRPRKF